MGFNDITEDVRSGPFRQSVSTIILLRKRFGIQTLRLGKHERMAD